MKFTRLAWVLAMHLSCAGSAPKGQQPSWRASEVTTEVHSDGQRVRLQSFTFTPRSKAAAAYNALGGPSEKRLRLAAAIEQDVSQVAGELNLAAPLHDRRLDVAAGDLADLASQGITLDYAFIEFAMQRQGIIEPSPDIIKVEGGYEAEEAMRAKIRERLPSMLSTENYARFGVGQSSSGDKEMTILAFQVSRVKTNPIPRRLPEEGRLPLRVVLSPGIHTPTLYVTRVAGGVETLPWSRQTGRELAAYVGCEGQVGKHHVEVTAEDQSGPSVLANFPIWCGVDPPASQTTFFSNEVVEDAATGEQQMLDLINVDRRRAGLLDLAIDTRLADVARGHSQDMARTGVVAHVSPTTGAAADRVKRAAIRTSMVLENVARTYGISEAQRGLMNSSGHRANILAADATHVGVGVALGKRVDGRREVFVTQVFAKFPQKINERDARQILLAKIRSASGASEDEKLTQIARVFAAQLAEGVSTKRASDMASEALNIDQSKFSKVQSYVTVLSDLDSFSGRDALSDHEISHFGLGYAQGDHDEMGQDAMRVVLIMGYP